MRFRKKLLILFLTLSSVSYGQEYQPVKNEKALISDFKNSTVKINTLQASFVETKHIKVLKEAQKTTGVFYYKKDDKMRWEQISPESYIILIDDTSLKIKDGDKNRNLKGSKIATQIRELLIGLVSGNFSEDKGFTKKYFENKDSFLIELFPTKRQVRNIYSKISLTFDKKSLYLLQLNFFESSGDTSEMKFSKHKVNLQLKDQIFNSF